MDLTGMFKISIFAASISHDLSITGTPAEISGIFTGEVREVFVLVLHRGYFLSRHFGGG
jgi:hypothetical protein